MKEELLYCYSAKAILQDELPSKWAETFVRLKMDFHRKFCKGYVFSIGHGIDFFQNVIDSVVHDKPWKEQSEYGESFRKFVKTLK